MAFLTDRPLCQGELTFWLVTDDHFDGQEASGFLAEGSVYILAHSESGHHHVLDRDVAEVERMPASEGLEILRAIVREPTAVRNLGASGHADLPLGAGTYLVIKQRELGMDDMIRAAAD